MVSKMAEQEHIVVLGAGKSASYLIRYLAEWTEKNNCGLLVADASPEVLNKIKENFEGRVETVCLDHEQVTISHCVKQASLVISLLPVAFHYQVAQACVRYSKNMLTASYISKEIQELEPQIKNKGLTFVFECGLDPGIDHMSALDMLAKIKRRQEEVVSFISVTGGLVDPASEGNNPWQYKFTWNPRNVVLAGKGTALFREHGLIKKIPYHKLFVSARPLNWQGEQELEYYPNRDSFKYQELYDLQNVQTFIRGTIRRRGYCEAWNVLVQLGMTDDTVSIGPFKTYQDFLTVFIKDQKWGKNFLSELLKQEVSEEVWTKINYLSLDGLDTFSKDNRCAADYLLEVLEKKWALGEHDKDWVLMQHRIHAIKNGVERVYWATLSVKGESKQYTAMAKTVGLPLAMAAAMVYTGEWRKVGLHIPTDPSLYEPILNQLKAEGVSFEEGEF